MPYITINIRFSGYGRECHSELTEVPGTAVEVTHTTRRSSGYGYGSLTELTEVPGARVEVLK